MTFALAAFVPGLALGSFLNVVAARVPLRRSIVRPASACMTCATPIALRDNVPLLSYLLLRGRCRACGARIPLRYPAVELATALHLSPEWVIGAAGAGAFLLVAAIVYPAGMGMGDVKLALLMGAALGCVVPVALMVGMVVAVVPSIVLFARHGARARKMGIPLGPFLALGTVVGLFAGHALLDAYLKQLH